MQASARTDIGSSVDMWTDKRAVRNETQLRCTKLRKIHIRHPILRPKAMNTEGTSGDASHRYNVGVGRGTSSLTLT